MKGPLSYVGGKNRLANQIIAEMPEHRTYIEPFGGGAQVLFRKNPSEVEVLNDLDGELVNFYRVCQGHHMELLRCLRYSLLSRKLYQLLAITDPANLTDINRAARYFILQKCSFGGRVNRQNFATHITKHPTFTPRRIPEIIYLAYRRLLDVVIECLPFQKIFEKYDRESSFFYLDPPYYGINLYNHNFSHTDFEELEMIVRKLKGKFLLSINDHPEVRKLFAGFKVEEVSLPYTIQKHKGRRYNELFIKNY
jgi:DNA adenine methylase